MRVCGCERERESLRVFLRVSFRDGHFTFGTNTLNIPTHVLKVYTVYTYCIHMCALFIIHNILAIGSVRTLCHHVNGLAMLYKIFSSSTVRSRDKIARVRRVRASYGYSSVLSPEVDYSSPQRYSSPPNAAGSRCSVSPLEV